VQVEHGLRVERGRGEAVDRVGGDDDGLAALDRVDRSVDHARNLSIAAQNSSGFSTKVMCPQSSTTSFCAPVTPSAMSSAHAGPQMKSYAPVIASVGASIDASASRMSHSAM